MNLRPATERDVPSLRAVWNESVSFDPCHRELFEEKTRLDPDFDPAMWLLIEVADEIAGWGFAVCRPARTKRGHIKFLVVDARYRGQGLGSVMLDALEKQLQDRDVQEVRIDEAAPNYLNPGVDIRYTDGLRFFASRGYVEIGTALHQRVPLTGRDFSGTDEIDALQSRGIQVRRAARPDVSAIRAMLSAEWPAWMAEVIRALANDPVSVHLAWCGHRLIGFAAYDGNNLGTGWFGPMGTLPDCRGLGIGSVLLKQCLLDQQAQGHAFSIIPWVGPVEFYRQHAGAEAWRHFQRFAKQV